MSRLIIITALAGATLAILMTAIPAGAGPMPVRAPVAPAQPVIPPGNGTVAGHTTPNPWGGATTLNINNGQPNQNPQTGTGPSTPAHPAEKPPTTQPVAFKAPTSQPQLTLDSAAQQAGLVFTAAVDSAHVVDRSNGIIMMTVAFKDFAMLKGDKPTVVRFNYVFNQGQYLPAAGKKVIVAANMPGLAQPDAGPANGVGGGHAMFKAAMPSVMSTLPRILFVAEATDDNAASVKTAIAQATPAAK